MSLIALELGGGSQPIKTRDPNRSDYINMDAWECPGVDIVHDATIFPWPFEDNSVSNIYSSEFMEHISYNDLPGLLKEAYRVLVPGGKFSFECPNFLGLAQILTLEVNSPEREIYLKRGIFGDQSRPFDIHRNALLGSEMYRLFNLMKFKDVQSYDAPTWREDYKPLLDQFGEKFMQRVKLCMEATK